MICHRCQRSLRKGEGIKCGVCDSKFHNKCISACIKDLRECGDKGYQWKCALCQSFAEKTTSKENLVNAINVLSEKFELINKIQLPKLNSELAHIKLVTDRIAKQNEDMLRKISDEKKKCYEKRSSGQSHSLRKRNVNIIPKMQYFENNDHVPTMSATEKPARYRTRRRSYLLNRMFHLLNRKLNRAKMSPRSRHR